MNPLLLALLASFAFALNNFFSRLGLEESSPATAVAVNVTLSALGLWVLAAFLSPIRPFLSVKLWPFILSGIFAPCLARSLLFRGYEHMGLARSDVLAGSIPLFAVLLAIGTIGERPSPLTVVGTISIVFGIGLLSYKRDVDKPWPRWAIVLPLAAAFFFALRDVLTKFGLQLIPAPVTGAAVTTTVAGLFLNLPYLFRKGRARLLLTKRSFFFFCLAALSATAAYLMMFTALRWGMVSQVSPLIGIFPLFSVLLSFLFLQSEERVSWKVVVGGSLVVGGASCILSS
ncbi:MAG: DMT family transporter [Nitrospinota bacterium]